MYRITENDAKSTSIDITKEPYGWNNDLPPKCVQQMAIVAMKLYLSQLEETDKLIEILNLTVEALKRKTHGINQKIFTCQSIMSPIRRLPDELLGEIFMHCLPSNCHYGTFDSQAPILLTLVCQKWRRIAISIPQLWTNIPILCQDSASSQQSITSSRLRHWIMRSASLPLTISIVFVKKEFHIMYRYAYKQGAYAPAEKGFGRLAQLLASQAHRWSKFSFKGSYAQLAYFVNAVSQNNEGGEPNPYPALYRIDAYLVDGDAQTRLAGDTPQKSMLTATTLRVLWLRGSHSDLHIVRWGTLTHLTILDPVHRHIARNILRHCNKLEACAIRIAPANVRSQIMPTSHLTVDDRREVLLPSLKTLYVEGELDDEANICNSIHAPSLQHFLFYPAMGKGTMLTPLSHSTQSPLGTFLRRCPSLERLAINPVNLAGHSMLHIYSSCPQLTGVVLDPRDSIQRRRPSSTPLVHSSRRLGSRLKFNLHPLLTQQLICPTSETVIELTETLLPSLTSFAVYGLYTDSSMLKLLMQFLIRRIYSARGDPTLIAAGDTTESLHDEQAPPYKTLESIELDVHTGKDLLFDGTSAIVQHAASVG